MKKKKEKPVKFLTKKAQNQMLIVSIICLVLFVLGLLLIILFGFNIVNLSKSANTAFLITGAVILLVSIIIEMISFPLIKKYGEKEYDEVNEENNEIFFKK